MKINKNKISAAIIALFFILSMTLITTTNAHSPPWQIPTFMYCSASPNPAGVGQQTTIFFWLNDIPPTANGIYGDRWIFNLTITYPDGSVHSQGPFTSDPIGSKAINFVPDMVGNYTFVAGFNSYVLTNVNPNPAVIAQNTTPYINDTYLSSVSAPAVLTVQQTPVATTPQNPLPPDYWTFPILAKNQNWYTISGNWLATTYPIVNNYQPFSTAPNTAHVAWTKQLNLGGLVGGLTGFGTVGGASMYYTGSSYETEWSSWNLAGPPIVIDGTLYYNQMDPDSRIGFYSVDLKTGQTNWFENGTGPMQGGYGTGSTGNYPQLSFGQIYDYDSVNQAGSFAYLWSSYTNTTPGAVTSPFPITGTVWQMYDAYTGSAICNIKNVPAGSGNVSTMQVTSPRDGSILIYVFNPFQGWLALWNSSYCIQQATYVAGSNVYSEWRPYLGYTYDGRNGYQWNVTIPTNLPLPLLTSTALSLNAAMQWVVQPGGSLSTSDPSMILGSSGINPGAYETQDYSVWALSLDPSTRGQILWKDLFSEPENVDANKNMTAYIAGVDPQSGVFVMRNKESTQMYGYSLTTGSLMWGPTPKANAWDSFQYPNTGTQFNAANGLFYIYNMAGIVYCFNITTGAPVWASSTNPAGSDSPYPNWPFGAAAGSKIAVIADGKFYLTTDEHSETVPVYQGWGTYCWDAYTGANLWNITGVFGTNPIVADGYMLTLNSMNQQIMAFGKGLSATTVTASPGLGNVITLQGTVTDQSPGKTCIGIPTAGTPAIADKDMTAWMQYLYLQSPKPTDATGVPVKLSYIDPNGNSYDIATTTSDISGHYSYQFAPTIPGLYTVLASFGGSDSYYSSTSETSFTYAPTVSAATPSPAPVSTADSYFLPMSIAIILVIVIVGAILAVLLLRKHP